MNNNRKYRSKEEAERGNVQEGTYWQEEMKVWGGLIQNDSNYYTLVHGVVIQIY